MIMHVHRITSMLIGVVTAHSIMLLVKKFTTVRIIGLGNTGCAALFILAPI